MIALRFHREGSWLTIRLAHGLLNFFFRQKQNKTRAVNAAKISCSSLHRNPTLIYNVLLKSQQWQINNSLESIPNQWQVWIQICFHFSFFLLYLYFAPILNSTFTQIGWFFFCKQHMVQKSFSLETQPDVVSSFNTFRSINETQLFGQL